MTNKLSDETARELDYVIFASGGDSGMCGD